MVRFYYEFIFFASFVHIFYLKRFAETWLVELVVLGKVLSYTTGCGIPVPEDAADGNNHLHPFVIHLIRFIDHYIPSAKCFFFSNRNVRADVQIPGNRQRKSKRKDTVDLYVSQSLPYKQIEASVPTMGGVNLLHVYYNCLGEGRIVFSVAASSCHPIRITHQEFAQDLCERVIPALLAAEKEVDDVLRRAVNSRNRKEKQNPSAIQLDLSLFYRIKSSYETYFHYLLNLSNQKYNSCIPLKDSCSTKEFSPSYQCSKCAEQECLLCKCEGSISMESIPFSEPKRVAYWNYHMPITDFNKLYGDST